MFSLFAHRFPSSGSGLIRSLFGEIYLRCRLARGAEGPARRRAKNDLNHSLIQSAIRYYTSGLYRLVPATEAANRTLSYV